LEKLATGFSRLGVIVGLMFPPSPGNLLHLYLKGLTETLAIAVTVVEIVDVGGMGFFLDRRPATKPD